MRKRISYKKDVVTEAQNVGLIGFSKNLGNSLLDPRDLGAVSPIDDMLNLYDLFADETLKFIEVAIRVEGQLTEWAFIYDDTADDSDITFYYPVTQIKLEKTTDKGFVDAIFSYYGIKPAITIDEILAVDGYYSITPDGTVQKVGEIKKKIFAQPEEVVECVKTILKDTRPVSEILTELIK